MTVADLIVFLQKQPQDLPVAFRIHSEQALLEEDEIQVKSLPYPRGDGWIHNDRGDGTQPKRLYLLFPGN